MGNSYYKDITIATGILHSHLTDFSKQGKVDCPSLSDTLVEDEKLPHQYQYNWQECRIFPDIPSLEEISIVPG